jgi:prolyl-tRNA synthetase
MQMSELFLPTLREVPTDANVISHQLMLRAGMIRKVASGIYTFLPLGLRVIKKISLIIEEEMNNIGAQEILMPMVQPAELWRESGRFEKYGPELLRFKDRKGSWFCLGPTHEEVVTALIRDHIKSYKNLPLTLYQIQTKFRDETRPRFGLMRGREFIMKDAYSFCADKNSQDEIYEKMRHAYHRIFNRCGLKFRAVKAATGAIGGELSHEFQVLAQSGEDAIASCDKCGYTANVELAEIMQAKLSFASSTKQLMEVITKDQFTITDQAKCLGICEESIVKSLLYRVDEKIYMVLLCGDQQVSEAKLKSALFANVLELVDEEEAQKWVGPKGFIGPIGIDDRIKIIADNGLVGKINLVIGANKKDTHWANVNISRDVKADFLDIRQANAGDHCGQCGDPFKILRGIEVGHIFYLGKTYSKAMSATIQNEQGETNEIEMGCYGIGVSRTAAAAIEQNHDERGIIWPVSIAPYHVHIIRLGDDDKLVQLADDIYKNLLNAGIEVLLDDRDERAGVKFNDADLVGCPLRITLGKHGLKNRKMEIILRKDQAKECKLISIDCDYVAQIKELLDIRGAQAN